MLTLGVFRASGSALTAMLSMLICLSWAAWEQVKMSGSLFMFMSKTALIGCTQVVQLLSRWTQGKQDAPPQVSLRRLQPVMMSLQSHLC